MLYKIMSTVKARIDDDKIVSPTQTMLEDNVLKTSKHIPKNIRENIVTANVSVDKNSVCKNGVCRGDIYVETNNPLHLMEQRQLVDGMTAISNEKNDPIMVPAVIRNSPTNDVTFVSKDDHWSISDTPNVSDSAFIFACVDTSFPNVPDTDLKSTYCGANDIIRAFNKGINNLGLKTVYADMSMCEKSDGSIHRPCCVIFQKTARCHQNVNADILHEYIQKTFEDPSSKLNSLGAVYCGIKVDDMSTTKNAIIGSVSLENIQMANMRLMSELKSVKDDIDIALCNEDAYDNPLFVNGFGKNISKHLPSHTRDVLFSDHSGPTMAQGFRSSTEQPLSTNWKYAPACGINVSGEKSIIDQLAKRTSDIAMTMNENGGYDENTPLIKDIIKGHRVDMDVKSGQNLILLLDKNQIKNISKKDVINSFVQSLSDISSDFTVNPNLPTPLVGDIKMCKSLETKKDMTYDKTIIETLDDIIEPVSKEKEQQMSF